MERAEKLQEAIFNTVSTFLYGVPMTIYSLRLDHLPTALQRKPSNVESSRSELAVGHL